MGRPELVEDQASRHLHRADLCFVLARAFLPPPRDLSFRRWADSLAEDLAELASALGLNAEGALAVLNSPPRHIAHMTDPVAWLVGYSGLFLTPPVRVPLNTGLYLEGSLGGEAAHMMRTCYERAGFAPNQSFRDLPDHVAMQLEFLGWLEERAAQGDDQAAEFATEFLDSFVSGWAEPLERACRAAADERPEAAVFAELAALIRQLLV